jgi:hypothetical protein
MAVSAKMAVFWVVAPCNVGKLLPDYMVPQPRRQPSRKLRLVVHVTGLRGNRNAFQIIREMTILLTVM